MERSGKRKKNTKVKGRITGETWKTEEYVGVRSSKPSNRLEKGTHQKLRLNEGKVTPTPASAYGIKGAAWKKKEELFPGYGTQRSHRRR